MILTAAVSSGLRAKLVSPTCVIKKFLFQIGRVKRQFGPEPSVEFGCLLGLFCFPMIFHSIGSLLDRPVDWKQIGRKSDLWPENRRKNLEVLDAVTGVVDNEI